MEQSTHEIRVCFLQAFFEQGVIIFYNKQY